MNETPATGNLWIKLALVVAFAAAIAVFFLLDGPRYVNLRELQRNGDLLRGHVRGQYAVALLATVAVYAAATALNLPIGIVLSLGAGFLLGRWVGTAAVVVGATLGATGAFLAARYLFADAAQRRIGALAQRLIHGFDEDAFNYLLFLRLVPLFPFWLVNLVPAFTRIRVRTFVLGTALGIVPGTFVFVNAGSALARVRTTRDILGTGTLVAFALLGALALVPVLVRKHRASTSTTTLS